MSILKTIHLLIVFSTAMSFMAMAQESKRECVERYSLLASGDSVYVPNLQRWNDIKYGMPFWQPDSTIDYKIQIVNPERRRSFAVPLDSLAKWYPEIREQLKRKYRPKQEK